MNTFPSNSQWPQIAHFFLQLIGSPLRPNEIDIQIIESHIQEWHKNNFHPPKALILGVTPEYYHLNWPSGAVVRAIDRTQAMIQHVWPGPVENIIHAEWLDMPVPNASLDMVLCDGGLHLLPYPTGQALLATRIASSLVQGGICIFRLFSPSGTPEKPDNVIKDLGQRKIPNLNILKLRLGMALQESPHTGVKLDDIWQYLHQFFPNQSKLAQHLGWTEEHLGAINAYRDTTARYYFVTEEQAIDCFKNAGFSLITRNYPDYLLGECCPTLVFEYRQ